MLLIFQAHPVPYHSPVFRALQQDFNVPIHVIYGSDFSMVGYMDKGFATHLCWDHTLLEGYSSQFLSRVSTGGAKCYEEVKPWGMTRAADSHEATAVLSIGYYARYDLSAISYALRRGLPLLFRGETNDEAHSRSPIFNALRSMYLRQLYARCAGMLYIGHHSKQHFRRYGVHEEKLFFSPYCIDEDLFDSTLNSRTRNRILVRKNLGIPEEALVIVFSGKLSAKKGVDLLIDAIRLLPESWHSRIHLLLVGDGPLRDQLLNQTLASPKISSSFVGFQNQDALSAYYNAADVLVLPSRERETWGVVVNEALLNGIPCIVSERVGCQPDLIHSGQTGEVFQTGNSAALANALMSLLPQLPSDIISDNCRTQARKYSVKAAAEGIANAWHSLSTPHLP